MAASLKFLRSSYVESEERVIAELKEVGKPFVLIINSTRPKSEEALQLRGELQAKYDIPVIDA